MDSKEQKDRESTEKPTETVQDLSAAKLAPEKEEQVKGGLLRKRVLDT
jgi:hypothetical protein